MQHTSKPAVQTSSAIRSGRAYLASPRIIPAGFMLFSSAPRHDRSPGSTNLVQLAHHANARAQRGRGGAVPIRHVDRNFRNVDVQAMTRGEELAIEGESVAAQERHDMAGHVG